MGGWDLTTNRISVFIIRFLCSSVSQKMGFTRAKGR